MQLTLRHLTTYRYSHPIPSAIQLLRMTPRPYEGLAVIRWRVSGGRNRVLPSFVDGFGNLVHMHSVNRPHQTATVLVEGVVETSTTDGTIRGTPEPMPPEFFLRITPLTQPDEAIAQLAADGARGAQLPDRLFALMEAVRARVDYRSGMTDAQTPAARALALGSGVCQDHAHLLIAACRVLGVPARYIGGYLWTGDGGNGDQANHAWVEAHVERHGWIGLDPANTTAPGESHIRVGVGLDYWSAAPVRGVRRGDAGETLDVTVEVAATENAQ
jgi:transglutaminase-like putative cysteine protease